MTQNLYNLYNLKNSDPRYWFEKSKDLWIAANLLEEKVKNHFQSIERFIGDQSVEIEERSGVVDVYFMLVGFCFESYLKGKLVEKILEEKEWDRFDDSKLDETLKEHNLEKLIDELEIGKVLRKTERRTLQALTECLIWAGRYPTPTSLKYFKPRLLSGSDVERIANFHARFERRMNGLI